MVLGLIGWLFFVKLLTYSLSVTDEIMTGAFT